MLKKTFRGLCDSLTVAYIAVKNGVADIKKDEHAMEVIQVVMLIAVGVLAIVAIWAGINGFLEQMWNRITGSGATTQSGPSISPP